MSEPILQVQSLVVDFPVAGGWLRAVDGVSFDILRGETLAIVGESGSGKSVTMSAVIGRARAAGARVSGTVLMDGVDMLQAPESRLEQLRGRRVAVIPQDPSTALNPVRTVGKQMSEMLTVHRKLSKREAAEVSEDSLRQVAIPDPRRQLSAYPMELSGGMLQRVLIATALALEPDIVIADEATTALDVSVQAQILNLIQTRIKDAGMTLIMISHDLSVVSGLADRTAVMYAGQIAEISNVERLFHDPQHPYSEALVGCIPEIRVDGQRAVLRGIPGRLPDPRARPKGCLFAARCSYSVAKCRDQRPVLRPNREGRVRACWMTEDVPLAAVPRTGGGTSDQLELEASVPASNRDDSALLRVHNLEVAYRKPSILSWGPGARLVAVEDVSLELRAGETLGVVGESGCGKSSLGKAVLRLVKASAGAITFMDEDLLRMPKARLRQTRPRMQLVLQSSRQAFDPSMSVAASLNEALNAANVARRNRRQEQIEELLRVVELPPRVAEALPQELSGGQQQRVNIARALATRPSLIVADEPTAALDVSVRAQILRLLTRIQREQHLGYLLISHDLTVISQMADRVAVIYLGRIIESGVTLQVLTSPRHPYTRALMQAVPPPDPIMARGRGLHPVGGEPPNPANRPGGCYFHPRCPFATDRCRTERPELRDLGDSHLAACHYAETISGWPGSGEPVLDTAQA